MTLHKYKKILRPVLRPLYKLYSNTRTTLNTFEVPIKKLLCGGSNGIRAFRYAELIGNFLMPSTTVYETPHVKLLQQYEKIGDKIFDPEILESTEYYQYALQSMNLTGAYFYDRKEKIKILVERFIAQHQGQNLDLPPQPGQSFSNHPIWLRPIKYSSCYEVIDGHHRIARAIMRGEQTIKGLLYEKEPALTPLQQLLLDCLWINKQKWLYQPIESPELQDEWRLIRACTDRLGWMKDFLNQRKISPANKTYIDIGSSYGWFVKEFGSMGFQSFGMDRDPFGIEVGVKVYNLNKNQIIHSDISLGLEKLLDQGISYNVVSCLSVLHHFVSGKSSLPAETLLKYLDKITQQVLFIDTGEEHEPAFQEILTGWSPKYIHSWILNNSNFKEVIPLGIDNDRKPPFEAYYNRTLFACVK